jgi:hypothetical protein
VDDMELNNSDELYDLDYLLIDRRGDLEDLG